MCKDVELCGSTCVYYPVSSRSGHMSFSSSLVNFNTWTLELPYCPRIPLENVIGMRAVHVVLLHEGVELCRVVVQQRRRCSYLKH